MRPAPKPTGGSEGDASFDCGEPGVFSDEWIDRITGLENVMAHAPDGSEMFEVVRFHSPSAAAQEPPPAANRPSTAVDAPTPTTP